MSAERLTNLFLDYHKAIVEKVKEERGHPPRKCKPLQLWRARRFFQGLALEGRTLLDQASRILSGLVVAHPLPNANHRTSIFFVQAFLEANGLRFPHYRGRRGWRRRFRLDANAHIRDSKYLLNLKRNQSWWAGRHRRGKRIMYLPGGGRRTIRGTDLGLSRRTYNRRHQEVTKAWLTKLLGDQSERYLKTPDDSLSKLIAQSERRMSSHERES